MKLLKYFKFSMAFSKKGNYRLQCNNQISLNQRTNIHTLIGCIEKKMDYKLKHYVQVKNNRYICLLESRWNVRKKKNHVIRIICKRLIEVEFNFRISKLNSVAVLFSDVTDGFWKNFSKDYVFLHFKIRKSWEFLYTL